MERNVKQVIETDNFTNLIVRVNNKTAKVTKIGSHWKREKQKESRL